MDVERKGGGLPQGEERAASVVSDNPHLYSRSISMVGDGLKMRGNCFENNGPCSRENEVKISKNRFLAIKACRTMLQPSS